MNEHILRIAKDMYDEHRIRVSEQYFAEYWQYKLRMNQLDSKGSIMHGEKPKYDLVYLDAEIPHQQRKIDTAVAAVDAQLDLGRQFVAEHLASFVECALAEATFDGAAVSQSIAT